MRPALAVAILLLVASPYVGPALAAAQPKGRKVAFLVGVGEYKFNFANLGTAPERDVNDLAKTLSAGGFEVVTLTGTGVGARRATKANMEDRFARLLNGGGDPEKALGKHDLLLVHLCGHGFQADAPDPATGKKEEQPFFCPLDAVPDKPETMVSLNGLIAATEPRGMTALFLVDACREAKDPNRGTRGGVQGNKVTLRKNTAVLFACGQGQLSHQSEKADGGHGLFTHAVLETVRDAPNGRVSWSQLVSGVEQKFQSDAFRRMLPPGQVQSPVEAKGELGYIELLVFDPLAKDLRALLDTCVFRGTPVKIYYQTAAAGRIDAWRKGAETGSPAGMVLYGDCLLNGTGVAKDERAARGWYEKAARAGSPGAMNQLGYMYSDGLGGLAKNNAEALRWYQKGADLGYCRCTLNAGIQHLIGEGVPKDEKKAIECFRRAKQGGDAMAAFLLGEAYLVGLGGLTKDNRQAAAHYKLASDLGVPQGMVAYGAVLLGDVPIPGVPRDEREGVRLIRAAVDLEDPDAHAVLANAYARGLGGLPKDMAERQRLLERGAALGSTLAKTALNPPKK